MPRHGIAFPRQSSGLIHGAARGVRNAFKSRAELQREADIHYLKDKLRLQDTEQQAAEYFSSKIRECLGNRMTRLNDAVHLYAHSG